MYGGAFLATALLVTLPFFMVGAPTELLVSSSFQLKDASASGVLAVVLLLIADIVAPIPSSSVAIAAGAGFGAPLGAVVTWAGMTGGSVIGYLIGLYGASRFESLLAKSERCFSEHGLTERFGLISIAICRPIPVLAEASAVMAGVVRMPVRGYITVSASSNLAIAIVYSSVGANVMTSGSFGWLVLASAAAPLPAWIVFFTIKRTRAQSIKEVT